MEFKYKIVLEPTLATYKENGQVFTGDEDTFNGILIIEATDEATADKIRMTYTDIRMWEKID
jgi:hypothetical protein